MALCLLMESGSLNNKCIVNKRRYRGGALHRGCVCYWRNTLFLLERPALQNHSNRDLKMSCRTQTGGVCVREIRCSGSKAQHTSVQMKQGDVCVRRALRVGVSETFVEEFLSNSAAFCSRGARALHHHVGPPRGCRVRLSCWKTFLEEQESDIDASEVEELRRRPAVRTSSSSGASFNFHLVHALFHLKFRISPGNSLFHVQREETR